MAGKGALPSDSIIFTGELGSENGPIPALFSAATLNSYTAFFVSLTSLYSVVEMASLVACTHCTELSWRQCMI